MTQQYDLVIRGGTVVDGTGGEPFVADVAVERGKIVAMGRVSGAGREEIDAKGMIVTPGFVDGHTHYDGQITWENTLAPSSDHGVTTVVMGNCGVGFAPVKSTDHQLVIKLMEGVEDIPEIVMAEGVPWNWETFPEYLDAIEKQHSDIDFAAQLPHSPLRVFVMGDRGAALEPATDEDLNEMRRLTAEAIEAGALGVTTSRNLFHRFRNGKLAPSVNSPEDELLALAGGLKDAGAGVFQLNPNLDEDARDEMAVFRSIASAAGRPLNFSLIPTPFRTENWDYYVEGVQAANDDGITINAQFLPRTMGVLFGLDLSYHPFSLNPSYRAIADLPLAEKVARMRDPEFRKQLISEEPDDPNPAFVGIVKNASYLSVIGKDANYNIKGEDYIAERATRQGIPVREAIYDALLEDDGHAILGATAGPSLPHLERTQPLFDMPNAVVALGDGGAHYAMVCDAPYTTYLLTQRVGLGGLDLPKAIRSLTSKPAHSIGLGDRGIVAVGYKADLNVIDIDRLKLHRPHISRDLPADGKRLSQKSEGYVATIVSGSVTYRNGEATGNLPGRLIRGAQRPDQALIDQKANA